MSRLQSWLAGLWAAFGTAALLSTWMQRVPSPIEMEMMAQAFQWDEPRSDSRALSEPPALASGVCCAGCCPT